MSESNNEPSGAHMRHMAPCGWVEISKRVDKDEGKSIGPIRNGHVASEMTTHLTTIFSQPVWGEEGERETDGGRGRKS